jgi:hypothetical protein
MQTSGRNALSLGAGKSRAGILSRTVVQWAAIAALSLLQACSGTGTPNNYQSGNAGNPAPGVTLQAIQITPSTPLISIAETRQLQAVGVYSDGSTNNLTSQVTWAASSPASSSSSSGTNPPSYVSISSGGVATGQAIGIATITATFGSVTGVLQLIGDTNGYTASTVGILSVPFGSSIVDAAYLPQQTLIQGAYAVQEVNLDADQFSSVLPVEQALIASIPMPAGFTPNAAVASQSNSLVAVISYSSPNVQIIDASNLASDVASNTVTSTFTAPITQTVTINGTKCMICAGVLNPLNGELLLSTAQGFYSMNFTTGAFAALPFTPAPAPAQTFSFNPLAPDPYILAPNPATGEIQFMDLTTNVVTTANSAQTGVTTPGAAAIDVVTNNAAVVDANVNNQVLLGLSSLQAPVYTPVPDVGICGPGATTPLNMATLGVGANAIPQNSLHTLLVGQTSGTCLGFEIWPDAPGLTEQSAFYGFGVIPDDPDGNVFANGSDPNSIATFNSVSNKSDYALLVDSSQQWMAKINFSILFNNAEICPTCGSGVTLPSGSLVPPLYLCAEGPSCFTPIPMVFLPSPSTAVTVSVNNISFGSLAVGTSSPPIPVTLADIGLNQIAPQISVQGANPAAFTLTTSCSNILPERSTCSIVAMFVPTSAGPASAAINVAYSGGPALTVQLSGTGF